MPVEATMTVAPLEIQGWHTRPLPRRPSDQPTTTDLFTVTRYTKTTTSVSQTFKWSANWQHRLDHARSRYIHFTKEYEGLMFRGPQALLLDVYRDKERIVETELRHRKREKLPPSSRISLPGDATDLILRQLGLGDDRVVISKFDIDLRRHDLNTLRSSNWLNDEVINFYLQMLHDRSRHQSRLPSLHVFSSFFYPKLKDRGYDSVRSSTRKIKPSLLQFTDMILFPIHLGMHWCMAGIDFRHRIITYYDSLHGNSALCLQLLRSWLEQESRDKCGLEFESADWTGLCCKDMPTQKNGYDCGVFSLAVAEHISRDAPLLFSQSDMPYWRDRISYEIITGKLLACPTDN